MEVTNAYATDWENAFENVVCKVSAIFVAASMCYFANAGLRFFLRIYNMYIRNIHEHLKPTEIDAGKGHVAFFRKLITVNYLI